ncbi:hypothetical protein N431DRAFT_28032 [Stipitochalara longipes BDJ]|nr:hypothetical protein N431DRAFT_28032 [Stipitochalara longipes BDJ]
MQLIDHAMATWEMRLLLCLMVQWSQHRHRWVSRFAEDRHLVSRTSATRMQPFPDNDFAFVQWSGGSETSPQVLGNEVTKLSPSTTTQHGPGMSARLRAQFTSIFIPPIYSQKSQPPLCPLSSWALMFCWAGRPQGRDAARIRETAEGWPPLRASDRVIQPVGYHREYCGILFLL